MSEKHTPVEFEVCEYDGKQCQHVREVNAELRGALKAMQKACDEWAAEFTQKKRAMNWGVVNDAYCKAAAALAKGA